jgi:hypothetical protein
VDINDESATNDVTVPEIELEAVTVQAQVRPHGHDLSVVGAADRSVARN